MEERTRRCGLIDTGEVTNDPKRTLWVDPGMGQVSVLRPDWSTGYQATGETANDPRRVRIIDSQGIKWDVTPEVAAKLTQG